MQEEKLSIINKTQLLGDKPICQRVCVLDASDIGQTYCPELVEVCLVQEGVGACTVLGQEIPCKKGDVFIVPPGVKHGYVSSAEDGLTLRKVWFCIDDWFEGDIADASSKRFCYGVFLDSPIVAYAMLTERSQNQINAMLNTISRELNECEAEWREMVRGYLSALLITVSRYVGGAIKSECVFHTREWGVTYALMREVEERYDDAELTLEGLAGQLYVSKSHLSKQFKKFTGNTFTDYLRSVRLESARVLLSETRLTVAEIVEKCGMKDVASFYHAFSRAYNCTPARYRQESIKNKNKQGVDKMSIICEISQNLQAGKAKVVKELVQQAIDQGIPAEKILNEGLLSGMSVVGEKFKNNEVYVPEVLVAARAMNMGTQILKPYLMESGVTAKGKVCIGTVQGDLHDIGKNLVKMMMEGKGLEVVDLGTDVAPETFVTAAIEQDCQVICCSALLTTTMGVMAEVVKLATEKGIRDKVKIMVGGAPVNQEFCTAIGADAYTVDAASAADAAAAFCAKD